MLAAQTSRFRKVPGSLLRFLVLSGTHQFSRVPDPPSSVANGAAPHRSAKPPTPQKCSGECSERCRPETECSGKCWEKCLPLMSLLGTRRTSTFPSTSPSTPFFGRHLPEHSPEHPSGELGVLHFCRGPPRSQFKR